MGKFIDEAGNRFGRLVVISLADGHTKGQAYKWNCLCDCGNKRVVNGVSLRTSHVRSCGCLEKENLKLIHQNAHERITHGFSDHDLYQIWKGMIRRCQDKNHQSYHNYGGRGIKVCERWQNSLELFIKDMGPRPSKKHSLDRKKNNEDYYPQNCKWATVSEQVSNKRTNRMVTVKGEVMTLKAAWRKYGIIAWSAFHNRLAKGWEIEKALTTPALPANKRNTKKYESIN